MSKETKLKRACFREAEREYARRQKEQNNKKSESDVQRAKAQLTSQIERIQVKRDKLVLDVVELRKTDPEAAKLLTTVGKKVDDRIRELRYMLATANSESVLSEVYSLYDDTLNLMRELKTKPVIFTPKKGMGKIKKNKAIHDIMLNRADEARVEEMNLYMGDVVASEGEGSAFENDVLAAERKAQIDEFDD